MCKRTSIRSQVEDGIVKTEFTVVRPYVLCEIIAEINGKRYRAVKHALQSRHDVWNEELGCEIAYGRTVMEIAKHAQLVD